MLLGPGRPDDHAALSALALRSKGFWGYDPVLLEAFRSELTLSAAQATSATVARTEPGGPIVGFHLLADGRGAPDTGELEMLFVEPAAIGTGLGRALLADALTQAAARGWARLRVASDPGAEGFYVAHGAHRIGTVPSGSVAGRVLPLLELPVSPPGGSAGSG